MKAAWLVSSSDLGGSALGTHLGVFAVRTETSLARDEVRFDHPAFGAVPQSSSPPPPPPPSSSQPEPLVCPDWCFQ